MTTFTSEDREAAEYQGPEFIIGDYRLRKSDDGSKIQIARFFEGVLVDAEVYNIEDVAATIEEFYENNL